MDMELNNYAHARTQMTGRKRMITMKKEKEIGKKSFCRSDKTPRMALHIVFQRERRSCC